MLVRTSNPGAADVQELALADGGSVSERVAALVSRTRCAVGRRLPALPTSAPWSARPRQSGLSGCAQLMPAAVFLLPGVGAQGGRVEDLAAAFAPGPAGGLVTASRGIVRAHESGGGDPAGAARAEAQRLRELAWGLAS